MSISYSFSLYKFKVEFFGTEGVVYDHPIARSGHRVIIDGFNLYSFGGFHPTIDNYDDGAWRENSPQFSEIWKYNLIRQQWTRLPTLCKHPGLVSHCLIKHGRLAIMFGGTVREFYAEANNKLTIFNLDTNTWFEDIATTGPLPKQLYGQAITNDGNTVYIIGGTQGYEYSLDVHVLDILQKTWTYLKARNTSGEIISERYRHEIIKHGSHLFVLGGGTSNCAFSLSRIPTLNLDSLTWTMTYTLPDPASKTFPQFRKCHVVIKYKNYIYIQGGQINITHRDGTQDIPTNDFWRLNLDDLTWQRMPSSSSQKLYFHSGAITEDGCMYIFGGTTGNCRRTNQIEKVWVDIPSLRTMSMEAINHYFPSLKNNHSSELRKIGIPIFLAKQLRPRDFLIKK